MRKYSIILTLTGLMFSFNLYSQLNNDLQIKYSGIWSGNLPCADCEYIICRLNLKSDMSYNMQLVYHDKDVKPYNTDGKWDISDNILILNEASTSNIQKYRYTENKLILLDNNGIELQNSILKKLSRSSIEPNSTLDKWQNKRLNGIDFIGMGNEPFWNINIELDKNKMSFGRLLNNEMVEFTDIKEVPVMDVPVITYHSMNAKHEITVEITKQECVDNMSGETFPYKVTVKLRTGKSNKIDTLTGCGKYLADYRLSDIWIINSVNGKNIADYNLPAGKKIPMIEISSAEERFNGYAGCNNFFGSFEAKGNKIRFGKVASTMMMCPDITLERDMFDILNDAYFEFKIENNKLSLNDMKGSTVIDFKKGD